MVAKPTNLKQATKPNSKTNSFKAGASHFSLKNAFK